MNDIETLGEVVDRLAKELCPGCRDKLFFDGEVHVCADGVDCEPCQKDEAATKLRAAISAERERQLTIIDEAGVRYMDERNRESDWQTRIRLLAKVAACQELASAIRRPGEERKGS